MSYRFGITLILAAVLHGCAPTPASVVQDAAAALGGADAIEAANTLVMQGTGQTYRLAQQPNPDSDLPIYELHEYRMEMDLENHRMARRSDTNGSLHHRLSGDSAAVEPGGRWPDRL